VRICAATRRSSSRNENFRRPTQTFQQKGTSSYHPSAVTFTDRSPTVIIRVTDAVVAIAQQSIRRSTPTRFVIFIAAVVERDAISAVTTQRNRSRCIVTVPLPTVVNLK